VRRATAEVGGGVSPVLTVIYDVEVLVSHDFDCFYSLKVFAISCHSKSSIPLVSHSHASKERVFCSCYTPVPLSNLISSNCTVTTNE